MSELSYAAIMLLILLGGSALGVFVQPFLSEHHRSQETTDLIRLVITMLVTFAALVLGLLTSSVKASFDVVDNDLRSFSINLIQLDRLMHQYGSETDSARALLRSYTAAAIASTWPTEPKPPGDYYPTRVEPPSSNSIESVKLGDMLAQIEIDLHLSFGVERSACHKNGRTRRVWNQRAQSAAERGTFFSHDYCPPLTPTETTGWAARLRRRDRARGIHARARCTLRRHAIARRRESPARRGSALRRDECCAG